jgi:hypothetical protein
MLVQGETLVEINGDGEIGAILCISYMHVHRINTLDPSILAPFLTTSSNQHKLHVPLKRASSETVLLCQFRKMNHPHFTRRLNLVIA